MAPAVKQVSACTVTVSDVLTTYTITIGGVSVSYIGGGSATANATGLAAAAAASTHPYFTAVVWTSNVAIVTGTALIAGAPFVFTTSVSGGAGTISGMSTSVVSAGPSDWSTAANWSLGAVPVSTDAVVIQDVSQNISYGLAQSGVTLASLTVMKSFTGFIGQDRTNFTTDGNGATNSATRANEYRPIYLAISATVCTLGANYGAATPNGSQRILIDLGSNVSTIEVLGTASSAETGRAASIRLKCNHASTALYVRSAPGGVCVAMDAPGETSTLSLISVSDVTTGSKVYSGLGVTLTTWTQNGGQNLLQAAATVTTITKNGGTLQTEGTFAVTTWNDNAGSSIPNSTGTIGTYNLSGGTADFSQSNRARTVTTMVPLKGSTLKHPDTGVLTITTLTLPAATPFQMALS